MKTGKGRMAFSITGATEDRMGFPSLSFRKKFDIRLYLKAAIKTGYLCGRPCEGKKIISV